MEALNFDSVATQEAPKTTEQLFNTWYERNHRAAQKQAAKLEKSPDLAADLVQDAFLKMLKPDSNGLPKFLSDEDGKGKLLNTTIKNLYLDQLRKRQRNATLTAGNLSETLGGESGYHSSSRAENFQKLVNNAISNCGETYKETLELRFKSLTYDEIATKQGISVSNVKNRLFRGKSKLSKELLKLGIDKFDLSSL